MDHPGTATPGTAAAAASTSSAQELSGGDWARFPLLDALRERRSRRFGRGMHIPGGPLAHESGHPPLPLSETEESILAFAAGGITGFALSDWDWAPGAGGNMMAGLIGRTVASADAIASVPLVVINDRGAWLQKRPRDLSPSEVPELLQLASDAEFSELWRRSRTRIADERPAPPLHPPYNLNPNRWSLYAPGTTYFLPVSDLTLLYINALLEVFNEQSGFFALDERAMFRPAGVGRFARSRGGHMDDDPRKLKAMPIEFIERTMAELIAVEQGMMLQNLGLMCEAIGLGGFSHYASHDTAWFQALGFRMAELPISRFFGVGAVVRWALRLRGQDASIPYPVGLERDGEVLLRPFCPPYYRSMEAAVRAVVDMKFGPAGIYRGGLSGSAWRDPAAVAREIPSVSERAIDATVAYCEYVWKRYRRFPAYLPPFHTLMGFQAHHVDSAFYERHYDSAVLSNRHHRHLEEWH